MFKCELIGENGTFDREEGFESIKDAFEWASGRGSHYCAYIKNSETSELWKVQILSSKKDMVVRINARNGNVYTVNEGDFEKMIDGFKCNDYGCNKYDRDF